ncbi:MAG: PAS domain S-box protein [Methanoculleus sp.]
MADSHQDRAPFDRAVLDALEDGLLVVDGDRKVSWYNPAIARILGIQKDDAIGMELDPLFTVYFLPIIEDDDSVQSLRRIFENSATQPFLLCRARTPDGVRRCLSISSRQAFAGTGLRLIKVRDATAEMYTHHFKAALDRSPVVVFVQDAELRYIWSYNQQLGPTDASIIGLSDGDVFPEEAGHLVALKQRVLETGEIVRATVAFTIAGERRIRDLTLKPLRDAEGRIVGVAGTAFDVTARSRVEEALREKTHELRERMDELRCLYTIAHLVKTPGMTLDQLLQAVADTLPMGWQYPANTEVRVTVDGRDYYRGDPVDSPWNQKSPIVVHGKQVGEIEVRCRAEVPEGNEGPFLPEEQMLLDSITNRLGQFLEQLQAEAAFEESEEKFRGIAQRSFDLIVTSYLNCGLNYISPAMERILGYTPEEMVGTDWEDYILPTSLLVWREGRRRVLRGEQVEKLQIEVRRKDGETAILELNESPIIERKAIVGFQVIGRDISERVLHERLREQAFDMTERNIAQFAVLADHVRHPLQVIMGVADLLSDETIAEKLREQVRRVNMQISELDREWMESRKIREFLKRYEL